MSKFNKLFIGSVVAASMLALVHTGAWALKSARTMDAVQQNEVASMVALTSNASLGRASTTGNASTDCASASHTSAR